MELEVLRSIAWVDEARPAIAFVQIKSLGVGGRAGADGRRRLADPDIDDPVGRPLSAVHLPRIGGCGPGRKGTGSVPALGRVS